MAPEPGLQVRAEPFIGGDHLEDLAGLELFQRLGGFADRDRAEEPVAVENAVGSDTRGAHQTFQTVLAPCSCPAARMLTCAAIFFAASRKACAAGEPG